MLKRQIIQSGTAHKLLFDNLNKVYYCVIALIITDLQKRQLLYFYQKKKMQQRLTCFAVNLKSPKSILSIMQMG